VGEDAEVVAVVNQNVINQCVVSQLGIGFRPELARFIESRDDIAFVEIIAEDYSHLECIPQALRDLQERGVTIIPHCLSLSLGGADSIDLGRVKHLNSLARYFDSPFVSDHVAFVRAGNLESGHLLPVKRSEATLQIIAENITTVKEHLSVPLVLENIATTFQWPDNEMGEVEFVSRVLEDSDCGLLLDLSNLFASSHNLGFDALEYLRALPLQRLKYVHMAGGIFKDKLYHDSHGHPLNHQSIALLTALKALCPVARVMLERDDNFPADGELTCELGAIANA